MTRFSSNVQFLCIPLGQGNEAMDKARLKSFIVYHAAQDEEGKKVQTRLTSWKYCVTVADELLSWTTLFNRIFNVSFT